MGTKFSETSDSIIVTIVARVERTRNPGGASGGARPGFRVRSTGYGGGLRSVSVDHAHAALRQPLGEPDEQRLVERDAPVVRQLELALDTTIAVLDDDRARPVAEGREQLEQTAGRGIAVAGDTQSFGQPLADRGEIV